MHNPLSKIPGIHVMLMSTVVLTAGCSLLREDKALAEKKETIEQKKKYYTTLAGDIAEGNLKKGATTRTVRTLYGAPDDSVFTDSGTSRFEIWTYERIMKTVDDTDWQPIRLYFNDQKLVSWQH
jgi:hypothetical protein